MSTNPLERNPWKKISTRQIYKNPWISVREDKVITPAGKEGIYGVVETRAATGVIAVTPENEVYMVGQYRYPVDEYSWEIIEGGSEQGEDPAVAAKRELKEEAGVVCSEFVQLGPEVHLSNCFSSERAFFYLARNLTLVEAEPESTELLQVKKIPLAEAVRMVEAGEIKDAMSIIGLQRAAKYLGL